MYWMVNWLEEMKHPWFATKTPCNTEMTAVLPFTTRDLFKQQTKPSVNETSRFSGIRCEGF